MKTTFTITDAAILVPHDGAAEWSYCGECGQSIDWANDVMFGPNSGRDHDDTSCPYCGHDDTAYLEAKFADLSAAEIDSLLAAIAEHHGRLSESIIAAYEGLLARIKDGPTNWDILVSDGGGGEDWYECEGGIDDAVAYGDSRAEKCRFDFGDDADGELRISVRPSAADEIEMGKSSVTRYRTAV